VAGEEIMPVAEQAPAGIGAAASVVLDLTRLLPGPLSARFLVQAGYRVIRIEGPQGDLLARVAPAAYRWVNEGKTLRRLNLKTPSGRKKLLELVATARVLIESNRGGVMDRLGLGPEVLRAHNPNLCYVRLAGFRGEDSPGHDLSYLAAAGLVERFPWERFQFADLSGAFWGALAAFQGMAAGGGFYEVYLCEAAAASAYPVLPYLDGGVICYALYPARKGRIALAALEARLWRALCAALGHESWHDAAFSPTRAQNPIYRKLGVIFAGRDAVTWENWARDRELPLRAVAESLPRDSSLRPPWQRLES